MIRAPAFAPLDLLAPAVALGAGVGAFRLLHRLAVAAYEPAAGPAVRTRARPARRRPTGPGPTRPGPRLDRAVPSPPDRARVDRAPPDRARLDRARARPGSDPTGPESTGPHPTGLDATAPAGIGRSGSGTGMSRRGMLAGSSAAVGLLSLGAGAGGLLLGGRTAELAAGGRPTGWPGSRWPNGPRPIPAGAAFPELGTPPFLTANAGLLPDRRGAADPQPRPRPTGRCASTGWSSASSP